MSMQLQLSLLIQILNDLRKALLHILVTITSTTQKNTFFINVRGTPSLYGVLWKKVLRVI